MLFRFPNFNSKFEAICNSIRILQQQKSSVSRIHQCHRNLTNKRYGFRIPQENYLDPFFMFSNRNYPGKQKIVEFWKMPVRIPLTKQPALSNNSCFHCHWNFPQGFPEEFWSEKLLAWSFTDTYLFIFWSEFSMNLRWLLLLT